MTSPLLDVASLVHSPMIGPPLRGVSFTIQPGERCVITGPNGAGKSTLSRCLAGLERPQAGQMTFDGRAMTGAPWEMVRAGLFVVLRGHRVFPELTVQENLSATLVSNGKRKSELDHSLARFPTLRDRLSQPAGTLSGGEQQMLALARALSCAPKLLVLDEPALGLSPLARKALYGQLAGYCANGGTVLTIEESLEGMGRWADRALLMVRGQIVREGAPSDVLNSPEAHEAYLMPAQRSSSALTAVADQTVPLPGGDSNAHPI